MEVSPLEAKAFTPEVAASTKQAVAVTPEMAASTCEATTFTAEAVAATSEMAASTPETAASIVDMEVIPGTQGTELRAAADAADSPAVTSPAADESPVQAIPDALAASSELALAAQQLQGEASSATQSQAVDLSSNCTGCSEAAGCASADEVAVEAESAADAEAGCGGEMAGGQEGSAAEQRVAQGLVGDAVGVEGAEGREAAGTTSCRQDAGSLGRVEGGGKDAGQGKRLLQEEGHLSAPRPQEERGMQQQQQHQQQQDQQQEEEEQQQQRQQPDSNSTGKVAGSEEVIDADAAVDESVPALEAAGTWGSDGSCGGVEAEEPLQWRAREEQQQQRDQEEALASEEGDKVRQGNHGGPCTTLSWHRE